jgi:predicted LPLAT superfamily acyltransferase
MAWAERWWPRWLFRPVLMAGTWIGVARMPVQRAHSRAYLTVALGRPPTLIDVWRHFFSFTESLMLLLRAGRGVRVSCELEPTNAAAFEAFARSPRPALFGTFHFGGSDMLGYLLSDLGRRVSILRQQVGNTADTRLLGARYGEHVSFLWINDPANLLFDVKAAIEKGDSLALKCDRLEFSARNEPFEFLGARRLFPFTIYHLAVLFDRPVVFCTAVPESRGKTLKVYSSPVFTPDPTRDRKTNLRVARQHFQGVLTQLDALVHAHPFLWYNFLELNPVATSTAS